MFFHYSLFVFVVVFSSINGALIPKDYVRSKVKHAHYAYTSDPTTPEQVHLSWDGDGTHMVVTWNTPQETPTVVQYGTSQQNLTFQVMGNVRKMVSGDLIHSRSQYVHRATMVDLLYRTAYYYRVGDGKNWSPVYNFRSLQDGSDWSPKFAIYGDFGLDNAQSLPRLQMAVKNQQIDMIIHVGDFGYDMRDNEGRVGDAFMRQIESVAAYVPYQTVVGNHEEYGNFTEYKNRFTMPGTENGFYYRFTVGPANFVVLSTEFYFYVYYGIWQIENQYNWLQKELAYLNKNRGQAPWIITLGHRPMYCTDDDGDDCLNRESIIRTGLPPLHLWPLEKLFYKYGVDLCVWAHEHSYERMWPVYDRKVYNGSNPTNPYENPSAPAHVTSGSAGCKEKLDHFKDPQPWDAFRASDYGFMMMNVVNKTHISLEQVSDDQGGKVIDSFILVKTSHGPYKKHH